MQNKLKQYNISLTELGEMFGYKNQMSFLASARKDKVVKGAIALIERIESLKPNSPTE